MHTKIAKKCFVTLIPKGKKTLLHFQGKNIPAVTIHPTATGQIPPVSGGHQLLGLLVSASLRAGGRRPPDRVTYGIGG